MAIEQFKTDEVILSNINQDQVPRQVVMQGEKDGRSLTVQVTNNGIVEPQAGLNLNLGWKHRTAKDKEGNLIQGLDAFQPVDRESGIFRIEYASSMAQPGTIDAEIQFVTATSVTKSQPFIITVKPSTVDDSAVESESSFTVLQEALVHVSQYDEKIEGLEISKAEKSDVSRLETSKAEKSDVSRLETSKAEKSDVSRLETSKAEKSDVSKIESMVSAMPSATPKETFVNLAALQSKYPNGNASAMVVLESDGKTGYVYLWDGSSWKKGALYQAQGLSENQITATELQKNVVSVSMAESSEIPNYDSQTQTLDFKSKLGAQSVILFGNYRIVVPIGTTVKVSAQELSASLQLIYNTDTELFDFYAWSKPLSQFEIRIGTLRRDGSKVSFPFNVTVDNLIPLVSETKKEREIIDTINSLTFGDIFVSGSIELSKYEFEQGTISNAGFTEDSETRIRSKNAINLAKGTELSVSGDYYFTYVYYQKDGTHVKTGVWSKKFIVPENYLVKLLIRKDDNSVFKPEEFRLEYLEGNYNGFQENVAAGSIPYSKINGAPKPSSSYMHVSFDDVKFLFQDLVKNKNVYTSVFDNPFLGKLSEYHKMYNASFSLYVFLEDFKKMDGTYATEFRSNSDWLKFGLHLNEEYLNYQNTTYQQAKSDYQSFIEKAFEITGTYSAVDRLPRLQNFAFNEVSLKGMMDANCGVIGMFTADDSRSSTYLGSKAEAYLRTHDGLFDELMQAHFLSTDLRIENYGSSVYETLFDMMSDYKLNDMFKSLIVFSHEQMYVQENGLILPSIANVEEVCRFASDFQIPFDFPQNRVQSYSTNRTSRFRKQEAFVVEFEQGALNDIGNEVDSLKAIRSKAIYLAEGSELTINVTENYFLRICKLENQTNANATFLENIQQSFSEIVDGQHYYRFVLEKLDQQDIDPFEAKNIDFQLLH